MAVFPIIITLFSDGNLNALDDLGGVGRYLLWCFTAGTAGGTIVGAGRRYLEAPLGRGVVTGLVVAAAFGTQFFMLSGPEVPADVFTFLLPATFIVGFVMSPLVSRAFSHWPNLEGVFDGLVLSQEPDADEDGETGAER